jgi:hypothetical protein
VFKDRVQGRIFGRKRDEVEGAWRKLHSEELHDLYSPPSIIRATDPEDDIVWTCSTHLEESGEEWNTNRNLVG